jgi:ABC-type multidrug transport system fused ATPase/permease subunit
VSFDLPPDGCIAVVGPSGAGKSSLIHVLLRFWDYQEGQILLAGQDLARYTQETLRRGIAVVSQHTHLFSGTIRDNLLLARPDATQDQLEQAARQAQLLRFIQSLPESFATWIGEQGLRLSGGQRQRLAIARAILRDAPLLLLDEPTANLDALTERQVMRALRTLMAGRATLVVTHRLSGLEAADEILVLRQGRVVERGRHYELMQIEGFYRHMWDLQNQIIEGLAVQDTELEV